MSSPQSLQRIQTLIADFQGDGDVFAEMLRNEDLPHLSFSQISTLEFCPYRYYLQYVLYQQPEPLPDYFTKGKLLHQCLARYYQAQKDGINIDLIDFKEEIVALSNPAFHTHLLNALQVHSQNRWQDCEIVAIEHPFVFSISAGLPPMVGIIDLILRNGETILLVDHKTGRNFYEDDELQVAIYSRYIMERYGIDQCRLFYDHYRWVENLERIRKPAFQRKEVSTLPASWSSYLERIQLAAEKIERVQAGTILPSSPSCFRCPYRHNCDRGH